MNRRITQGAPSAGRHPLKLKALLVSQDAGQTWLLVRQFYITDMVRNRYLDDLSYKVVGSVYSTEIQMATSQIRPSPNNEPPHPYKYPYEVQKNFVAALVCESNLWPWAAEHIRPEHFSSPAFREVVKLILKFYEKYNKCPSFDELLVELCDGLESEEIRLTKPETPDEICEIEQAAAGREDWCQGSSNSYPFGSSKTYRLTHV
jgi:hypothetical protein